MLSNSPPFRPPPEHQDSAVVMPAPVVSAQAAGTLLMFSHPSGFFRRVCPVLPFNPQGVNVLWGPTMPKGYLS
jgi:hypothetical protein